MFSRRELLGVLGGSAAAAAACRTGGGSAEGLTHDLVSSSVNAMARALRAKMISSRELVETCLARITEVNPRLNAVVQLVSDDALRDAEAADARTLRGERLGPLHGVPMTIKDSFDTAGIVSTAGTLGRREFVPARDAAIVARLKAAGAVLLGKTNTPELTFSGETDNLVYGRTNNPYNLDRSPGGSSGGAAAIIAAAGSPFDVGSDTGGSVRIPSHFCGVAGIKPTSGRVPRTGHIVAFEDAWESLTTLGPIARYVDDLVTLLPILVGPDGADPGVVPAPLGSPDAISLTGLRTAFYTDNGDEPANADTVRVVEEAADALSRAGAEVELKLPAPIPGAMELIFSLLTADGGTSIRRRLARAGTEDHHRFLDGFLDPDNAVSAAELTERMETWQTYRREMSRFMADFDVIVCPVWAHEAPPHSQPGEVSPAGVNYTAPYNLTGWPAAVVRCGTSPGGLPIGVQVVGRPWREDVVLAVARLWERELGGYRPSTAV